MIDELRDHVLEVVVSNPSDLARDEGTKGMYFTPMQAKAASEMMGVACHREAAARLSQVLRRHLQNAA